MKSLLAIFFILLMALMPLACTKGVSIPATPLASGSTPTPTTTISTTVVCGFSPVTLPGNVVSIAKPNPTIIHNLTEWNAYYTGFTGIYGTPVPIPTAPIDFSTQMLLIGWTPVCPAENVNLVSLCEGPSQITANFTVQEPCFLCYATASFAYPWAVAIPQSSLPLAVNYTTIPPCVLPPGLTPTPTATP